jgi:transposase
MSYSIDLRERVIRFVSKGGSRREAARRYAINPQTVCNWLRRPDAAKPGPTAPRLDMDKLAKLHAARPDAMLDELAAQLNAHPSTIYRRLRALGHTFKKRGSSLK